MVIRFEYKCPECGYEFLANNPSPACPKCGFSWEDIEEERNDNNG
jgi:DNA-directed RNA polymerase subunit RPC12/RpoP